MSLSRRFRSEIMYVENRNVLIAADAVRFGSEYCVHSFRRGNSRAVPINGDVECVDKSSPFSGIPVITAAVVLSKFVDVQCQRQRLH